MGVQASGIAADGRWKVYVTGFSRGTWGAPFHAYTGVGDIFVAQLNTGGVLMAAWFIDQVGMMWIRVFAVY